MHTVPDINSIMKKMLDAGLVCSAIERFFIPAWCDFATFEDAGARQAAFLEIAKRLGVTYTELISDETPLRLDVRRRGSAFRKSKNKETAKLETSRFVGIRLSNVIAEAYSRSRKFVKFSRKDVRVCRESILVGEPWISFSALLNFCWQCGIPVVYRKGGKGQAFDGLSIMTEKGIPVIILASERNTAWTSFTSRMNWGTSCSGIWMRLKKRCRKNKRMMRITLLIPCCAVLPIYRPCNRIFQRRN